MLDRRRPVRRRRDERYANCAVVEHDWYLGGSLMAWVVIYVRSHTELLVLNGPLTANTTSVKCYSRLFCLLFNITTQCCRMTTQDSIGRGWYSSLQQQNNLDRLDWPARSPDLSPIEHVWDILGQRKRQKALQPRTFQALGKVLQEEWRRIPQLQIARPIWSMRRGWTFVILSDL